MKGATPVPGPTITKGTDTSAGGRKVQVGLRLTWIWVQRPLASVLKSNESHYYNNESKRGTTNLFIDLLATSDTQARHRESAESEDLFPLI